MDEEESQESESQQSPFGLLFLVAIAFVLLIGMIALGTYINEQMQKEFGDDEVPSEIFKTIVDNTAILGTVLVICAPIILLAIIVYVKSKDKEEPGKARYLDTNDIKIEIGDVVNGDDAHHPTYWGKTI